MLNQPLIALVNSVLGTGKPTARGNYAYSCPFCNHHKPKLEINFETTDKGENLWNCWVCGTKGKKLYNLFKQIEAPQEKLEELSLLVNHSKIYKENKPVAVSYPTMLGWVVLAKADFKVPSNDPLNEPLRNVLDADDEIC